MTNFHHEVAATLRAARHHIVTYGLHQRGGFSEHCIGHSGMTPEEVPATAKVCSVGAIALTRGNKFWWGATAQDPVAQGAEQALSRAASCGRKTLAHWSDTSTVDRVTETFLRAALIEEAAGALQEAMA